jgi:hypothetical protein
MVAVFEVEPAGVGRLCSPPACFPCHRGQAPILERTSRPAVLDPVRVAEVNTCGDTPKDIELPLLSGSQRCILQAVRNLAYSMEPGRPWPAW